MPSVQSNQTPRNIVLHLQQVSKPGADEFIANAPDNATFIRFKKSGEGVVGAVMNDGSDAEFVFKIPTLPIVIGNYDIGDLRWEIRQHILDPRISGKHPVQRFFTFSFPGCPFDVCGFSPSITKMNQATQLIAGMPALLRVVMPTTQAVNAMLEEHLRSIIPE